METYSTEPSFLNAYDKKLNEMLSFLRQMIMYKNKENLTILMWKRFQVFYIIELDKLEFDEVNYAHSDCFKPNQVLQL